MSIRSKQGYAEFLKEDAIEQQQRAGELKRRQARELFETPSPWMVENLPQISPEANAGKSIEQVVQEIRGSFDAFRLGLDTRGVTLLPAGLTKLQRVAELNESVDWANPESFTKAFDYIEFLRAWNDTDRTIPVQTPVEQPVTQPTAEQTLDELLETTSSETREGRAKIRDAVQRAAVHGEYHATWSAFEASLYENFSPTPENVAQGHKGFVMTPIQKQTFYDTMLRRGMNFHRPKDYDTVRVALCKSGDLPALLYPTERLEIEMEMSNLNDREVRRQFAQRSRELNTKSLI